MVRMVTTAEHQYAGHRLRPKDEYDCEEQHVSLMLRMGWSKPLEFQPTRRKYQRRDMQAQ